MLFFLGYVTVVPSGFASCQDFFLWNSFFVFFISLLFEGNKTSLLLEITKKTGSQVFFLCWDQHFLKETTHRKRSSFSAWLQPFCCLWLATAWCFFRWRRWCVYWWMWCKLHGMKHGICLPSVTRFEFTTKRWEGYIARRFAGFGSWWSSHFVSVFLCEIELGFSCWKRWFSTGFPRWAKE